MKKQLLLVLPVLLMALTSCDEPGEITDIGDKATKEEVLEVIKNYGDLPETYSVSQKQEVNLTVSMSVDMAGMETKQDSTVSAKSEVEFAYDLKTENDHYFMMTQRIEQSSPDGDATNLNSSYSKKDGDKYIGVTVEDDKVTEQDITEDMIDQSVVNFAAQYRLSEYQLEGLTTAYFADKEPEYYINKDNVITIQGESTMDLSGIIGGGSSSTPGMAFIIETNIKIQYDQYGMLVFMKMDDGSINFDQTTEGMSIKMSGSLSMTAAGSSNGNVEHKTVEPLK